MITALDRAATYVSFVSAARVRCKAERDLDMVRNMSKAKGVVWGVLLAAVLLAGYIATSSAAAAVGLPSTVSAGGTENMERQAQPTAADGAKTASSEPQQGATAGTAGEDGETAPALNSPEPRFPRQFYVEFNETTYIPLLGTWQTDGNWWYDYEQRAELVERANGRGDRYCKSVHPRSDTRCSHLVVSGTRYLVFPELQQCCACCAADKGCGVLSPEWLAGAEFGGKTEMGGRDVYKWSVKGLQANDYYATADWGRIPVELDQQPNDLQAFHPDTFKRGPVDPVVFVVPEYCDPAQKCPWYSVCRLIRSGNAGSDV